MSYMAEERRAAFEAARTTTEAARAELALAGAELEQLRQTAREEDEDLRRAEARYEEARAREQSAVAYEAECRQALQEVLRAELGTDPEQDAQRLDPEVPLALFPVRIETRFDSDNSSLRVRIYPDEVLADSHEPGLTETERAAGVAYWESLRAGESVDSAWRTLVASVPMPRTEWVIRRCEKLKPERDPSDPNDLLRAEQWTRAAEARLLPDRWVVWLYPNTGSPRRVEGRLIQEPLALTHSPQTPQHSVRLGGDGPEVDEEMRWTFDFHRAVDVGMALDIRLYSDELRDGFRRVVVLGVKSSMSPEESSRRLEALFEGHHCTDGLAFVPQGTPTNNTEEGSAGFPPQNPDGEEAMRRVVDGVAAVDGGRAFEMMGMTPDLARSVEGASLREQEAARAMNVLLWPATVGHFLEQLMDPVISDAQIDDARRHFLDFVRGRGPLPAFRVGETPYGLVPVSSLEHWVPNERYESQTACDLPRYLQRARREWLRVSDDVPHVGRQPDDPDDDLLQVLGMDASTREVAVREAYGPTFMWNLLWHCGFDAQPWFNACRARFQGVLTMLQKRDWNPRIAGVLFASQARKFPGTLVAGGAMPGIDPQPAAYLASIRDTSLTQLNFWCQTWPEAPLFAQLLRHSALQAYARATRKLSTIYRDPVGLHPRIEPELGDLTPAGRAAGTLWNRFSRNLPGFGIVNQQLNFRTLIRDVPELQEFGEALSLIATLPVAEVERLFTETLDLCSHRLDAWITALPTARLAHLRRQRPSGVHVGAFGWLEDLRPRAAVYEDVSLPDGRRVRAERDAGGHIHAPSMEHAAAAAVLRNAHQSYEGLEAGRFAVDLSSSRVRGAQALLDAVRAGQPLGAVLGYRAERMLVERREHLAIEALREKFPIAAHKGPNEGGETSLVAARSVVDGLAMHTAWKDAPHTFFAGALSPYQFELEPVLKALDADLDAVSDLLSAEGVFQLVRGNTASAAASLDAMARGQRPSDPEVVRSPRSGMSITHRCAVLLDPGASETPSGPWAATPRAMAEPALNAWVASLLSEAERVACEVHYHRPSSGAGEQIARMGVEDLRLAPLDLLTLARSISTPEGHDELDSRLAYALSRQYPDAVVSAVDYGRGSMDFTFGDLLEAARAINVLLGHARPLTSQHLASTGNEPEPDAYSADTEARAAKAAAELNAATVALEQALTPSEPDGGEVAEALRTLAGFGVPGAWPMLSPERGTPATEDLIGQAELVLKAAQERVQAASEASNPVAMMKAVFGSDFVFVPEFEPANANELERAQDRGPDLKATAEDVRKWFQKAARVRPPLDALRRVELYSRALGGERLEMQPMHLPHVEDARWVGLPFDEDSRPAAGQTSLVLLNPSRRSLRERCTGLLFDEWSERIPSATQTTGITFHYDAPGAEAPQVVLLAVPPQPGASWTLETLGDVVNETLDLAKVRGVDSELLRELGNAIPAAFLPVSGGKEARFPTIPAHLTWLRRR
jgi:hypothetical protein